MPDRENLVFGEAEMRAAERAALGLGDAEQPSALCLSGGGVRSAAFCLGVLQALARRSLLHEFHYLSTVSGGGYIGGWLSRHIAQPINAPKDLGAVLQALLVRTAEESPQLSMLRRYSSFLAPHLGSLSGDVWAGGVLWVRNTVVNWIALLPPMLLCATLPLVYLLAILAVAGARMSGVRAAAETYPVGLAVALALAAAAALACLGVAIHNSCLALPSHSHPDTPETPADRHSRGRGSLLGWESRDIGRWIVRPIVIWAFLAPLVMAPVLDLADAVLPARDALIAPAPRPAVACPAPALACEAPTRPRFQTVVDLTPVPQASDDAGSRAALMLVMPGLSILVAVGAFFSARARLTRPSDYAHPDDTPAMRELRWEIRRRRKQAFDNNALAWIFSALVSGGLLALGGWLAVGARGLWLEALGPPWVVAAEAMRSTLYLALRRDGLRSDLDREWLARLNGDKLRVAALSLLLGVATLGLPLLVLDHFATVWTAAATGVGLLTGPFAAWLGRSATTAFAADGAQATRRGRSPQLVMNVAVGLFAASLLMLLGRAAALAVTGGHTLTAALWSADRLGLVDAQVSGNAAWAQFAAFFATALVLILVLFGCVVVIQRVVDLDRFSMHAVYRNRLVRAFLGSARDTRPGSGCDRRPDTYTGFDPSDDVRMADLLDRGVDPSSSLPRPTRRRLLPVINLALNDTSGSDTARAERKAASFTVTPLHCGSASLTWPRRADGAAAERRGAYVATPGYAGADMETGPTDGRKGITLGTAMTLSGAAVSPNMGYQSTPSGAFVMTLFNVRLGAWLPNPNRWRPGIADAERQDAERRLRQSGPRFGLDTLLDELAGHANATSDFVYLSDGGHFDNLGLYEMLRRRCSLILVIDAGRDEKYAYRDLGLAVQRALVDFGVSIDFVQPLDIGDALLRPHGACAQIRYAPETPGSTERKAGRLIYLKPWLPADAPTELRAFKALKESFPHESTADQFFTESDFESYRRLGEYLAEEMLATGIRQGTPPFDGRLGLGEVFERIAAACAHKGTATA